VPVANAPEGPLAGLTFAVKDIFQVEGYVTGCGNPDIQTKSPPAPAHAPVVATLLAAGARFAGKTKTAELAFSIDGRNDHDGTPVNPAAPGRVPGGSSSGSASAVAAGVVDFALGSDTGGSVRGPAAWCGIIGLRTTFGRIDIGGTMPLAQSFDTVGWFTRDPATYASVGAVLLGEDVEGPPLTRMALVEDAFALLDGEAERAALHSPVERVRRLLVEDAGVTAAPEGLLSWQQIYRTAQGFEAWRTHGGWLAWRKPRLNPAVARRFEVSSHVTEPEYRDARTQKLEVMRRVLDLVGKDRVLVLPTMPCIAPRLDASDGEFERVRTAAISMLCIAGLAGLPQISLPLATVDGCPFGLSLIAPPGRDRALIDLAVRVIG
jgi:amidase